MQYCVQVACVEAETELQPEVPVSDIHIYNEQGRVQRVQRVQV